MQLKDIPIGTKFSITDCASEFIIPGYPNLFTLIDKDINLPSCHCKDMNGISCYVLAHLEATVE